MTPQDYLLRALHDGDPQQSFHRDLQLTHVLSAKSIGVTVPLLIFLCVFVFQALWYSGYSDLSVPQFCWNCFVYMVPAPLLDALDNVTSTAPNLYRRRGISNTHAAKSEAMRRLIGFDTPNSMVNAVAKAGRRRLSSLSGLGRVTQAGRRKLSILPGLNLMGLNVYDRPPGLGNWDNSCYQNSVLQGLASLKTLPSYLSRNSPSFRTSANPRQTSTEMVDALSELIMDLNDSSNNGRRIWTPATLKSMSSWQQQDAQEYFSKVLDEIDKEISNFAAVKEENPGLGEELATSDRQSLHTKLRSDATTDDAALALRNPLEGLLAQRVGCTRCGYSEGLSMIPFNCLTVPLGKNWSYDLESCLDEYTNLEAIEGVECGKCTLLKTQRLLRTILERIKDDPEGSHIRDSTMARLASIDEALEEDDYDDKILSQKCKIPPKSRVTTTKSRQAIIARPPKSLVAHVNRSLFDEMTGDLKKNYAEVRFPAQLDLGPWCLGSAISSVDGNTEEWLLDPGRSMIAGSESPSRIRGPLYELRAVVTHYGRHENGHYICYRKHAISSGEDIDTESSEPEKKGKPREQWWRLSDDDVSQVSEENVLSQSGVFMLFYDCVEPAEAVVPVPKLPMSMSVSDSTVALIEQISELVIASAIALPAGNDEELMIPDSDEISTLMSREEGSITTSMSEIDEDDSEYDGIDKYEPAKAIHVSPYLEPGGNLLKTKGGEQESMSTNMVMV